MICITCSFSDPITTGCVGIIHSAELVNLRLTIVPINRAISQSRKTSCISLHESGDYLVAVFGQLPNGLETVPALTTTVTVSLDSPTSELNTATIIYVVAAAVLYGFLITLSLILIVILIVIKRKVQRASTSDDPPDDLSGCLHKFIPY